MRDSFKSANGNVLLSSSSCISCKCYKKRSTSLLSGHLYTSLIQFFLHSPFLSFFFSVFSMCFFLSVFAFPSGSKTAILKHFNFYWALEMWLLSLIMIIVSVALPLLAAVIAIIKFKLFSTCLNAIVSRTRWKWIVCRKRVSERNAGKNVDTSEKNETNSNKTSFILTYARMC